MHEKSIFCARAGYLEADTDAHCGSSLSGSFVWSLTMTDINCGWTELRAVWNKGATGVVSQIKDIEDNPSILGVLSDFVSSKVKHLPEFLFGNTILTKNPLTAYLLSNNGFKAVSTSGEIFFPNLSLMQFDYGSKIADVTKDLLLSDSIENLRTNIEKLQELTRIRITELDICLLYTSDAADD